MWKLLNLTLTLQLTLTLALIMAVHYVCTAVDRSYFFRRLFVHTTYNIKK